jgi:1,4-alpha-glucan branching enzyme
MKTTKRNSAGRKSIASAAGRAQIRTVHIEFSDAVAESVAIAGTFNDWRPEATPMERQDSGRWIKQLKLPPGTYEYCLVRNGVQWLPDPRSPERKPNPFGGCNSVITIPEVS